MTSEYIAISQPLTTGRPASDYDGTTTRVMEVGALSASDVAVIRPATETIVSTLLMSACIAATVVGNVLVVLSVFTYRSVLGGRGHKRRSSMTELHSVLLYFFRAMIFAIYYCSNISPVTGHCFTDICD